jgi:hypothetical protein
VAAINKNRFEYIDALRVVGAASVISFHYLSNGISNGSVTSIGLTPFSEIAKYGYLGVQLFFVVSGYLILMSTNRSAWEFAKGRVKRIYPLYWMAIILITAITYLPTLSKTQPDFLQILASITMFPTAFDQGWIDGAHWFMLIEIQFYLLIFVLLKLRAGKHLPTIFPIWAIVILIWYVFDLNRFNIWYLYGPFSFICGGAIIYSIKQSGWNLLRVVGLIAAIIFRKQGPQRKVYRYEVEPELSDENPYWLESEKMGKWGNEKTGKWESGEMNPSADSGSAETQSLAPQGETLGERPSIHLAKGETLGVRSIVYHCTPKKKDQQ